jgi:NitT/TauT family transport system substrate-binding protein
MRNAVTLPPLPRRSAHGEFDASLAPRGRMPRALDDALAGILRGPMGVMLLLVVLILLSSCGPSMPPTNVVRLGHFPNVTHAHGLVAHAMSRRGDGIVEKHLGPGMTVEWYVFHAGPSAMEALLADSLDATYVGPNPALNAHLRTAGEDVHVLAGATKGGAALVVRDAADVREPTQLRGKRVATPQLGNTQDVACRVFLMDLGFKITKTVGDVRIVPTENSDQLALFRSGDLDAAWTVEPWVSRLEREGGGRILHEETDALTTVLVGSKRFLGTRPDVARRLLAAHRELTEWIRANPDEAKELVRSELQHLSGRPLPRELLDHCWPRLAFTDAIEIAEFERCVRQAQRTGFIAEEVDLSRLIRHP